MIRLLSFASIINEYGTLILQGVLVTLLLSIIGTLIGFVLALIFGFVRVQTINPYDSTFIKIIKKIGIWFVKLYVTVFRGTPMIVQAIIFYYSFYQIGIQWSAFMAGLFTVSLNTTAYLTEVIRGGLEAVDRGQLEAARAMGMSQPKAMLLIIFPQAIKNSMASIGNEMVINIKDTSVLMVIGVIDLFNAVKTAAGETYETLNCYLIAAAIYLILTFAFTRLLMLIERKLGAPTKELTSSN